MDICYFPANFTTWNQGLTRQLKGHNFLQVEAKSCLSFQKPTRFLILARSPFLHDSNTLSPSVMLVLISGLHSRIQDSTSSILSASCPAQNSCLTTMQPPVCLHNSLITSIKSLQCSSETIVHSSVFCYTCYLQHWIYWLSCYSSWLSVTSSLIWSLNMY